MTNPYRALCAELDALLNDIASTHPNLSENGVRVVNDLSDRARALLDQPVAEGPTDEQIMELMPQQMRDDLAAAARALARFTGPKAAGAMRIILNRHAVDHARVVLDKWGNQ